MIMMHPPSLDEIRGLARLFSTSLDPFSQEGRGFRLFDIQPWKAGRREGVCINQRILLTWLSSPAALFDLGYAVSGDEWVVLLINLKSSPESAASADPSDPDRAVVLGSYSNWENALYDALLHA